MSFVVLLLKRFLVLQWKHHLCQWTNRSELAWIILCPPAICMLAVFLRLNYNAPTKTDHFFDEINLDNSWQELTTMLKERKSKALTKNSSFEHNIFVPQFIIAYAPDKYQQFEQIMSEAIVGLPGMKLLTYKDCNQLREHMQVKHYFAGVCFEVLRTVNRTVPPRQLKYSIIFPSELRCYEDTYIGATWLTNKSPRWEKSISNQTKNTELVWYVREGFIKIQRAISETFIRKLPNYIGTVPNITLRSFPIRSQEYDPMLHYLTCCLALMVIIGFLFSAQVLVLKMVIEKNGSLIVSMRNMKIGRVMYFCGWLFRNLTYSFVSCVLLTIILKVDWNEDSGVITHTHWTMVFMILMSYCTCSTAFCTIFSAVFSSPQTAVKALSMMWVFSYLPYCAWLSDEAAGYRMRFFIWTLPNSLLPMSFQLFFEEEELNMGDFNANTHEREETKHITLRQCLVYFYLMSVVFSAISIYIDVLSDTDFKSAKRLMRPTPRDSIENSHSQNQGRQHWISSTKIFEVDPSYKPNKVKIIQLGKRYTNSDKYAITNFTMNLHENEITVLMGHNGSGKTTLLAMLAGLMDPTRGTAIIEGHDMVTRRYHASRHIGAALDRNMLVPELSVANNIRFTCILKGTKWGAISEEITYYTNALQLHKKLHIMSKNLSPNDVNLLLISCAFCGGSSVVLIDDVHSDLDTVSQTNLWNLIKREKQNRTILLVSNSTTPTELLADRVAILSNGELKCTGTKSFLRSMYGHGYRLTCIRGTYCKSSQLMHFLKEYIPNIIVEADVGNRITFILETKYEDKFASLLNALENNLRQLDVVSMTLRETSMEEIFLQMGLESTNYNGSIVSSQNAQPLMLKEYLMFLETVKTNLVRGNRLIFQHIQSMVVKHWIACRRKISIMIINFLMVLLTTLLSFLTIAVNTKQPNVPTVSFNLSNVVHKHSIIQTVGMNELMQDLYQHYSDLINWYDTQLDNVYTAEGKDLYKLQKSSFTKLTEPKYFIGASFSDDQVTCWFNKIPSQSLPFSLNAVHNAVARYMHQEASIDVYMYPLPYNLENRHIENLPLSFASLLAGNLSICLCFVWTGTAWFLINERISGFKQLQLHSGARLSAFWISAFIMDLVHVTLISFWTLLITTYFLHAIEDPSVYGWYFFACFLSGLSTISTTYLITRAIDSAYYGYIMMSFYNVIGVLLFLTVQTMVGGGPIKNFPDVLQFMSQYTFAEIIHKIFIVYELKMRCTQDDVHFMSESVQECNVSPDCCMNPDYWESEYGVQFEFLTLIMVFLIAWILLLCLEFREYAHSIHLTRMVPTEDKQMEYIDHAIRHNRGSFRMDDSVIRERMVVQGLSCHDRKFYACVCDSVGKVVHDVRIINRIDLAICRGECISLLDLNERSSATLIQILAGKLRPSYGRVYIHGINMDTDHTQCMKLIGHCPAVNELPLYYTSKELLMLISNLHGVPKDKVHQYCRLVANLFGIQSAYTMPISKSSFGNRRRLALALALIGDPYIAFIEGAPCGLDPGGKRIIFDFVTAQRPKGRAFVFTSLNSAESERLCDRVAVLLNGHIWTIGPMIHLYGKRADGYLLEVKIKRLAIETINVRRGFSIQKNGQTPTKAISPQIKFLQFMEQEFPKAILREENDNVVVYQISLDSTQFSTLFYVLRRNSFILNIEDFYLSRNTLTAVYSEMLKAMVNENIQYKKKSQRHSKFL